MESPKIGPASSEASTLKPAPRMKAGSKPNYRLKTAMYDKGSLPLQFKFCGENRQSGRSIGALNRHSRKSSRFIEDHHGIVFVKHEKLP
jgi:hypothetical protein